MRVSSGVSIPNVQITLLINVLLIFARISLQLYNFATDCSIYWHREHVIIKFPFYLKTYTITRSVKWAYCLNVRSNYGSVSVPIKVIQGTSIQCSDLAYPIC